LNLEVRETLSSKVIVTSERHLGIKVSSVLH